MKPVGLWVVLAGICLGATPDPKAQSSARASLSGRVVDTSGKPLSGAAVRLDREGLTTSRTNTSASGEYRLGIESSDQTYSLIAYKADFLAESTNFFLSAAQDVKADFVLHDDTSIAGSVVALDKSPLNSVVVQAIRLGPKSGSGDKEPDAQTPTPTTLADIESAPLQPGLLGEYFQAGHRLSVLPDPDSLGQPAFRRVDRAVQFPDLTQFDAPDLHDNFYVGWNGFLRVSKHGRYTFYLTSDDGSRLSIDGKRLVDNDGPHSPLEKSGAIELTSGDHRLIVEYFQRDGPASCVLSWTAPGLAKQVVPPEVLFHRRSAFSRNEARRRQSIDTTLTDEKGIFRLRRLAPGQYQVRCHVLGGFTNSEPLLVRESPLLEPPLVSFEVAPFKKGSWRTDGTHEGLAGSVVHRIYSDPGLAGSIWFGTSGGLSRFDGKDFRNLTMEQGLSDNDVRSILCEPNGVAWLGTMRGVTRLDPITGETRRFTMKDGLLGNWVLSVAREPGGTLWFGTDFKKGVSRYDGKEFRNFTEAWPTDVPVPVIS
jgi:hypothetical protein